MNETTYVITCQRCGLYIRDSSRPCSEICDDCREKERAEDEEKEYARRDAAKQLKEIWKKYAEEE